MLHKVAWLYRSSQLYYHGDLVCLKCAGSELKSIDPVNLKVRFGRLRFGFDIRSDFLRVSCVRKQEFLVK